MGRSERREERAEREAFNVDGWVSAEEWHRMAKQATLGLKFVADHKEDQGFWCKKVQNLANQFLMIIIFLTSYVGRCGGWELILRSERHSQLARAEHKNVSTFRKHKIAEYHGPLKNMCLTAWWKVLRLSPEIPLRVHRTTHECEECGLYSTRLPDFLACLAQCQTPTLPKNSMAP